jgi:two-component system sensor histidine kinase CiaH
MKVRSRPILILGILFGYVLLQFLWWEILLVRQNGNIINEKQKLMELSYTDAALLERDISALHQKKKMQTIMIVSEGTVFLLLLLFGVYKIKVANDKETELNNRQKNFFLSITHELKTPIAATKLQLQTLQKQKLDEATRQELIHNALAETERLNILIDNVLMASRLDSGELQFSRGNTNLTELCNNILHRYYKEEIKKGELSIDLQPDVYARIDGFAFPSVITNLTDNALKYSANEKKVNFALSSANNEVMIKVADHGIGVADTDKEKIFKRFYRSGDESTRRTKGTGLGLYIARYIVGQHDGKIMVTNNTPSGSIFYVQLPVA